MTMSDPTDEEVRDVLSREVRRVLTLAGLKEMPISSSSDDGGYMFMVYDGKVCLRWVTENVFRDVTGQISVKFPRHPLHQMERAFTRAMERAMAELLLAAGFTIQQVPGVRCDADAAKETDDQLVVLAAPEFKIYTEI
jgi:hypothetical protein